MENQTKNRKKRLKKRKPMKCEKDFDYGLLPIAALCVIGVFIIAANSSIIRESVILVILGTLMLIAVVISAGKEDEPKEILMPILVVVIIVIMISLPSIIQGEKHKEELEISQKIDAFKDNRKLYCDGTIYSKKEGWSLEKEKLIKNKKYVYLKDCTL